MKLRSRGLGKKELIMDFRNYDVIQDGDEVKIIGKIIEPVNWDFSITVCTEDIAGLFKMATKKPTLRLMLKSLLKK